MSDTTDNFSDENDNQGSGKNFRRELEEKAAKAEERAKQLEQELNGIHRTNALKTAGLDLSVNEDGTPKNPLHKFFAEKYDGKLDADAIKAEATATGILQSQPLNPEVQNAAQQHAAMDRASYGADAAPTYGSQDAVRAEIAEAKKKGPQEFAAVLAKHRLIAEQ